MCKKCKNLKILSLKDCGYFLNDHFFEILIKVKKNSFKSNF